MNCKINWPLTRFMSILCWRHTFEPWLTINFKMWMREFLVVTVLHVEQVRAFRKKYTFCSGVTWLSYYTEVTLIWKSSFKLKLLYCVFMIVLSASTTYGVIPMGYSFIIDLKFSPNLFPSWHKRKQSISNQTRKNLYFPTQFAFSY